MNNQIKKDINNFINCDYYMEVKTLDEKIITSGKIINQKNMCTFKSKTIFLGNWLSVDNHYFFNIDSKKFIINITPNILPTIPVNKELLNTLIIKDWMKLLNIFTPICNIKNKAKKVDIFTDKDLSEADTEIKEFLYFLNRIPEITTFSSCCGHKKYHMYISFGIDVQNPQRAIDIFQRMYFVLHKLNLENLIFIRADQHHMIYKDSNYKTNNMRLEFYSKIGNKKVWKALTRFQTLYETLFQD